MDLILKGKIKGKSRVLDAGCGEGRNAIYFIREGHDYLGIDSDESKIRLAQYMSNNISTSKAKFQVEDIKSVSDTDKFDLVICSRVLHFSKSKDDFFETWTSLIEQLSPQGLIYVSMDSVISNDLGVPAANGRYEFPDGAVRFLITDSIYQEIIKGFEEIEPLKTLVQNEVRAQSFFCIEKKLDATLCKHRLGDLYKSSNIGTFDIVYVV